MTTDGPSLPHASLLEQQAFLRQLARSLVADAHRAEDLAQDATLAALEHAPANATSLRSWLARVVRNRAVNVGLADERRRARELVQQRPAPRSPDELEAQFQVQRRVIEAVDRLDEPYRTAILLRYYRDLSPTAIAEQLGVPIATVKSRLARALARLREQLDDTQPEGGRAWVAVLAGGLGELHRPVIAATLAAGGIAMGVKLALSVAAASGALVLGGWWLLRTEAASTPTLASAPAPVSTTALAEFERPTLKESQVADQRSPLETAAPANSTEVPARPAAWCLQLELRGWNEGDVGPATLAIRSRPGDEPAMVLSRELAPEVTLDLGELFAEPARRPDRLHVRVDHPAFLPAEIGVLVPAELLQPAASEGRLRATVDLTRAKAIVSGSVSVHEGFSPEHVRAAIFAMDGARPLRDPIEVAQLDESGHFRLRADKAREHAVVAFVQRETGQRNCTLRPETRRLTLEAGSAVELEPIRLGEGEVLEGRVTLLGGGEPPPGKVLAQMLDPRAFYLMELEWRQEQFEVSSVEGPWKARGAFRLTGLGPYRCRAVPTADWTESSMQVIRVEGSTASDTEVLPPDPSVSLVLDLVQVTLCVLGDGQPVEGANAFVRWSVGNGGTRGATSYTDALGRVGVELDPHKGLDVEIASARWPAKRVNLAPEELTPFGVIEIRLEGPGREPGSLAIRFEGDPAELSRAVVALTLYDVERYPSEKLNQILAAPPFATVSRLSSPPGLLGLVAIRPTGPSLRWAEESGEWVVHDLPAGRYVVRLAPRSAQASVPCTLVGEDFDLELEPGERAEHVWQAELGGAVRLNLTALASLRSARILDPNGVQAMVQYVVEGDRPGSFSAMSEVRAPGLYDLSSALPAGSYDLALVLEDRSEHKIPITIEPGKVLDLTVRPEDL